MRTQLDGGVLVFRAFLLGLGVSIAACGGGGGGGGSSSGPGNIVSDAQVSLASPGDGAENVSLSASVQAQFTRPMDINTFNPATFTVFRGPVQVAGAVQFQQNTATFIPSSELLPDTAYTATIIAAVKDNLGRPLPEAITWTFRTLDNVRPKVATFEPPSGSNNAAQNTQILVQFSEPVDPTTLDPNSTFVVRAFAPVASCDTPATPVAGLIDYDAQSRTARFMIPPPGLLSLAVQYSVTLTPGIKDMSGNPLGNELGQALTEPIQWCFRSTDEGAPSIVSFTPADNAINVPVANPNITVTFLDDDTSVGSIVRNGCFNGAFELLDTNSGLRINASVTFNAITQTATLTPDSDFSGAVQPFSLVANTRYIATVNSQLTDDVGNPLPIPVSWSFTTESKWRGPEPIENLDLATGSPIAVYDPVRDAFHVLWTQKESSTSTFDNLNANRLTGRYESPNFTYLRTIDGEVANVTGTPSLAVDSLGQVYSAWEQKSGSDPDFGIPTIQVNRLSAPPNQPGPSCPPGTLLPDTWDPGMSDPVDFNTLTVAKAADPQVAIAPDNTAYVVYAGSDGNDSNPPGSALESIYINRLLPGALFSGGWSGAVGIDQDGEEFGSAATQPQIAIAADGVVYVVWKQKVTGETVDSIWANRFLPGSTWSGFSWTGPIRIESDAGAAVDPRLLIIPPGAPGAGSIQVIWRQKMGTDTNHSLRHASYTPGSAWQTSSWSVNAASLDDLASANTKDILSLALTVVPGTNVQAGAGTLYAVWTQQPATLTTNSFWVARKQPGNPWNGPIQLNVTGSAVLGTSGIPPAIGVDVSGQVLVAFTKQSPAPPELLSRRLPPGANFATGWQNAVTVSATLLQPLSSRLTVDPIRGTYLLSFTPRFDPDGTGPLGAMGHAYINLFR